MAQALVYGIGFLLFVLLFFHSIDAQAKTITVDDDGDADYNNIRDAMDNASDGDILLIYPGNYLSVTNILNNITITGISKEKTYIHQIIINSHIKTNRNILIENITIGAATITDAINTSIDNIIIKTSIGIQRSELIRISNSNFYIDNLTRYSIFQLGGFIHGCTIINNTFIVNKSRVYNNGTFAINVNRFLNNTIINNTFKGYETAISLLRSDNNIIKGNVFYKNNKGIDIINSNNNFIVDNNFKDQYVGIQLLNSEKKLSNNKYSNVINPVNIQNNNNNDSISIGLITVIMTIIYIARTTNQKR